MAAQHIAVAMVGGAGVATVLASPGPTLKLRVTGFSLATDANTTSVVFYSRDGGDTQIGGITTLAALVGALAHPYHPDGWYETLPGGDLGIDPGVETIAGTVIVETI